MFLEIRFGIFTTVLINMEKLNIKVFSKFPQLGRKFSGMKIKRFCIHLFFHPKELTFKNGWPKT